MVHISETLTVLDPTAETARMEATPAPRPSTLQDKRLGLLANGKGNSEELLEAVLDELSERYRFSTVLRRNKGNASRPAPEAIVEEMAQECDIVVTATGD
jgi:hypothetical protein